MFETLKEFSNIVISGPQRSGTRIAARIVAEDAKKIYVDEKDLNYHDFRLLEWYLDRGNVVIQCPGLCHLLHRITTPSTLIIMTIRPIEEIQASEVRCWSDQSKLIELYKYGYSNGVISRIKYDFWNNHQKPILNERAREINYQSLERHSLFIKDRKNFRWDQTQ